MSETRESAAAAMVRIAGERFRIVRDQTTDALFAVSDELPPISLDRLGALLARSYHAEAGKVPAEAAKKAAVEILADPDAPVEDVLGPQEPSEEDLLRSEAERQERLEELREQCAGLLEVTDLLARLDGELGEDGFVGETRVPRFVYLCTCSALLDIGHDGFAERLASVKVDGATSAGKNYAVDAAVAYLPDDVVVRITGQSEKALVYGADSLERRFLYFPEGVGIRDDSDAAIFLRSLLSEGEIRYFVVVTQDGGVPVTEMIVRHGPTGALVTTSAVRLDRDLDARLLRTTIDDSELLTKKVIDRHGERAAHGGGKTRDRAGWHALYSWLLLQAPIRVRVPFAQKLAAKIPPAAVRLRRDVGTLFVLTAAHAALHLAMRETDAAGYLVATGADYTAARDLVDEILGANVERIAPEWALATWEAAPAGPDETITFAGLGRKLGIGTDAARDRALKLLETGNLTNLEQRPRYPAKLIRGDIVPGGSEGFLPRFEDLDHEDDHDVWGWVSSDATRTPEPPRETAQPSGIGGSGGRPEPQPDTRTSADEDRVSGWGSGGRPEPQKPHEQWDSARRSGDRVDFGENDPWYDNSEGRDGWNRADEPDEDLDQELEREAQKARDDGADLDEDDLF